MTAGVSAGGTQTSSEARSTLSHVFTVDVEEWFHGIDLPPSHWPRDTRLRVGLDRLLELLHIHRVHATFFVLGAVAERFPEVLHELMSEGHEVACHGYSHQLIYRQRRSEFRRDIQRARDVIGEATGVPPLGYRAPSFSVRKDSLWALDILGEEGFRWDSSIFPVINDRYGIPDAPTEAHVVSDLESPIVEIPITTISVLGLNVPFSGGAYLRILPWRMQERAWRKAGQLRRSVVLYIHPWELDPDHPRIRMSRRLSVTHYARLALTESRLSRLLGEYRFGSIQEVLLPGLGRPSEALASRGASRLTARRLHPFSSDNGGNEAQT